MPPNFDDLGKACRDVFSKGFNLGVFRISSRQTTCSGIMVKSDIAHTFENGAPTLIGAIERQYKFPSTRFTWVNRCYSNNFLFSGLSCQDKIATGVKVGVEIIWSLNTGEKIGTLLTQYKTDKVAVDLDVNYEDKTSNLVANGSVVAGYEAGWILGGKGQFDQGEGSLKSNTIAVGHSYSDVQLLLKCEDFDKFKGSIYHRVTNRLESGVEFGWSASGETPKTFLIAGRYLTDPCSCVRAKFNNESQVGVAYESMVGNGVTYAVSCEFDFKTFSKGGHKFGLSLDFDQ